MSNFFPRLVSPTSLLYIYIGLTQVAHGIYLASKLEPPGSFDLLFRFGFIWILGWWLLHDTRKRGIAWIPYDVGLFLYIAWSLLMPYYLLKTRGAKGLLPILAVIVTWIAALVVGMGLYLLLNLSTS